MEKTMVVRTKLWYIYYGKNYGTLPNSIELKLTKENNDRLPKTKTL